MGGKWLNNFIIVHWYFLDLSPTAHSIIMQSPWSIFSVHFDRCIHGVVPTPSQFWRNPVLFYWVSVLPITSQQGFSSSLCVSCHQFQGMRFMKYVNWSITFRGLPLKAEMTISCLKHMNSILSSFTSSPMLFAACFRWDLAWSSVLAWSSWSSV